MLFEAKIQINFYFHGVSELLVLTSRLRVLKLVTHMLRMTVV